MVDEWEIPVTSGAVKSVSFILITSGFAKETSEDSIASARENEEDLAVRTSTSMLLLPARDVESAEEAVDGDAAALARTTLL